MMEKLKNKQGLFIKSGKTVSCDYCGKKFYVIRWKLIHQKKHYCCRECAEKGERNGQFFACSTCGKRVYRTPSLLGRGKNVYCSRQCRAIAGGKALWNNPLSVAKRKKSHDKSRSRIGDAARKRYRDPEWVKKWLISTGAKPNKPEVKLNNILQRLLPKEYAVNVRGEIMILGGKIPDFVNINGQKKIIELFGDWWHSDKWIKEKGCYEDTEEGRTKYFSQFGYETLVIWEHELKELDSLTAKISNFNSEHK